MPSSTLKLKYNAASAKLQSTVGLWVDDVKLKLSLTDKAVKDPGAIADDLEIGVERPGHFILEHHLQKKATRFQFHSNAEVFDKNVKLTFVHHRGPNVTTLEGSSALDKHNKVVVKHNFAKPLPLVKYEYSKDHYAIEPQFDFGEKDKGAWGISLKHGHGKKEYIKATYLHKKHLAELELAKSIDKASALKVTAAFDTANLKRTPTVVFEKEWKF